MPPVRVSVFFIEVVPTVNECDDWGSSCERTIIDDACTRMKFDQYQSVAGGEATLSAARSGLNQKGSRACISHGGCKHGRNVLTR